MDEKNCESCCNKDSQNYQQICSLCDGQSNYNKTIIPPSVIFYSVGTILLTLSLIVILFNL